MNWTACLLILVYFAPCHSGFRRLLKEFRHNGEYNLTRGVLDPGTGQLYLAGTNVLYQLDSALRIVHRVETGPVEDSHLCGSSGCGQDRLHELKPTDNYNKLLVLAGEHDTLLSCGSVKQGLCRKYKRTDITDGVETLNQAVAANNREASTFGFIGPQRYNPWSNSDVLYVGTTFTDHGDYRHDVPAIASRNLYDLSIAEYSFSKQSLMRIDVKYRDHFLVNYVYGFNSSTHVYFLTVQKKSYLPGDSESGYITRISRSCITDSNFDTYSEVTLECRINGENHNLLQSATLQADQRSGATEHVLMGVFAPSEGPTSQPQRRTGFCSYTLQYINKLFDQNIHMCFNGTMQDRNLPYISGPVDEGKCPAAGSFGNILDFCETALKISGIRPIPQQVGVGIPNTLATSVTAATVSSNLVAIIGTSQGDIIKVLLMNGEATIVDSFKAVDNEPILQAIVEADEEKLLVLTPRRLRRLKMADCRRMEFCGECLGKRDPFCGWCSLENECSLASECSVRDRNPKWLSIGSAHQCIHLENITPASVSVQQLTNISLQISSLPDLPATDHYLCLYDGRTSTRATKVPGGLVCPSPPLAARPPIPAGTDHVTMELAVTLRSAVKEFVSTKIMIFNCASRSTCLECVSTLWPCSWCIYTNRCSHTGSTGEVCKEAIVSSDTSVFQLLQDNPSQLISRGEKNCPRVEVSNQLYIPNSVPQELKLTVSNLPDLTQYGGTPSFYCQVEIEAAKFRVPARLVGNQVTCDRTSYKYEAVTPMHNATISVLWDADHVVDRTNITLYKCGLVGSYKGHPDCSLCMTRTVDLGCVWCGTGCEFTKQCPVGQSDVCPQPRIDVVRPLSGPVDGGTEIVVEGSNLATALHQLKGRLMVGNIPCEVTDYQVSVRITCKTGRVGREGDLPIRLRGDNGIIESTVKFRYRDITVSGVTPKFGPRSGGTVISIEGVHLNIGSSISIYLDNIPCEVNTSQISSSRVTCTTGAAPAPLEVRSLVLLVDDARRTFKSPYTYTPDPTISEVKPKWSFVSGGRILTVHGQHLNTVEQPYIAALDDRGVGVGRSACTVVSSTQMDCPSPAIIAAAQLAGPVVQDDRQPSSPEIQSFRIGFEMDQVSSLLNLQTSNPGVNSELLYVEDPVYFKFPGNRKSYKGDALVIEGYNLNLAADESDLEVRIGTERCNVTSLTSTQMLCVPPQDPPAPLLASHPEVVVYVGRNLKFELGLLAYDIDSAFAIPPEVIGGIGAAAALTLFIAIAFMIVYKHKTSQAEREYKRIQIQMDTLENNVRSECKQAFAELQTDMSDLTMDLEMSGIPLLDHRTFVLKVFFPGVGDHPLFLDPRLHGVSRQKTDLDTAMLQFESLLGSKWFLLTFVETLERQKTFSVRDKVNVASLLMIILMTKMEYCTDILRCLLLRLIEKSLNTKHPHLMLRRTESIVEKMLTNWLAVCLYDYMKEYAGSSLFVLFKAIKFQIEKGPVDAMTQDARYSLAEDRLLREPVAANTVVCCVVQDELEEQVVVRVLDCDTISQVKAKILDAVYKNTPFSLRPGVDEVDLEWRCGQYTQLGTAGGQLVLQDVDITSKTEQNNLRRLNTLAHYGVKDKALVSLVPKQLDSPSHHIYQAVSVVGREGVYGHVSPQQNIYHYSTLGPTYQQHQAQQAYPHPSTTLPQGFTSQGGPQGFSSQGGPSQGLPPQLYGAQGICPQLTQENFYHFVKPDNPDSQPSVTRSHKSIPEIFLTRLLSTKGTVQKFVDDFFGTILKVPQNSFPAPVKWIFDLLDQVYTQHNLNNPEILHSWKSNCLPLRFWVNFIKNPDFIFDVNKTTTTDSCLSVIAQTFMDSCSLNENILGKDSPSSKLLFAKDIPLYRQLVLQYYNNIQQLPQVTDQELNFHLQQLSNSHVGEFDSLVALKELYIYVSKYYGELLLSLEENPNCRKLALAQRLKSLAMAVYPQQNMC